MNSFVIRNAMICDGSGREPFPGELRVEDHLISAVAEKLPADPKAENIDAGGKMLVPGFIDVHAHSDASVLAAPEAFGKLSQGVTTEISGNCGLSAFPVLTDEVRVHLEDLYRNYDIRIDWRDFTGYAAAVEACEPAINTMFLCGHNTLRANVLGYRPQTGTRADQEKMAHLLREMLSQGACGMSTGLLYIPGKFAPSSELTLLAAELGDKVYATHLRNEGDSVIEAVEEAISILPPGGKLQISHMKIAFPRNYHKIDDFFDRIEKAQENGLHVHADRYPYTYGQTSLSVILPPPYDKMTDRAIRNALHDSPEKVDMLSAELEKMDISWKWIILCTSSDPRVQDMFGEFFDKVAERTGIAPHRLCAELMAHDAVGTMAAFGGLSEEHMHRIISSEFVCCGSDETARPMDYSIGRSHPRGFGAFPEFFRIARQHLSAGETIRKMTSLPASIFGIRGRGLLKSGYFADLLLIDPEKYAACSTFGKPHQPAAGVCGVWVNGHLAYRDGEILRRAGHVIRQK